MPEPEAITTEPRLNRVLGATSGPYAGNTRAVIAISGLMLANLFVGALLAATWAGVPGMADLLKILGGTVIGADLLGVPFYFGKRSGEGG